MKIVKSITLMQQISRRCRRQGDRIGFVPTMGALHQGHLSLIHRALRENDTVVVSVFVNPAQFVAGEDFKKYPRNLSYDIGICRKEGVDIIFYPSAKQMYPAGYKTHVEVKDLNSTLCGKFRPGHFRGVATIVAKLFNIVEPDAAYFGQKDAQQAVIIRKMAQDLNMPLSIIIAPTKRHDDGLAMSSRNIYLNSRERKSAVVLNRALEFGRKIISSGQRNSRSIIAGIKNLIQKEPRVKIQYLEIVDSANLKPLAKVKGRVLIALAAYIGKTRLIDNIIVKV